MMFLPGLAVIFAGLLGGNSDIDAQVQTVLRKLHVKTVAMPKASVQKLTHHGETTRDVVRSLHADGVIACEVVKNDDGATLRLVIYEADGKLKSFSEHPLTGRKLGRDELETLRSNLADDVAALGGGAPEGDPEPEVEVAIPAKPAKPEPKVAKAEPKAEPKKAAVAKAPLEQATDDEIVILDENKAPQTSARTDQRLARTEAKAADAKPAPKPASTTDVASTEVASSDDVASADDAVSADEIASLTAGGGEVEPSSAPARALHLGAAAGIGIASRAFNPRPSSVAPYSSAPVASVVLDAHVRPTKRLQLGLGVERTLALSTEMRDGSSAPTTIARWEAAGTFALVQHGGVELGARLGGGRRTFAIESTETVRSPDSDYNYLIAGVTASAQLGQRIVLRAGAAFEPVLFGTEPTEMTLGEAARWAVELGAGVELRATNHVFVRATAQYQRFTWSWDMAGERGAGGAIDEYPSGALALGADY
jgi:hypothetical protein